MTPTERRARTARHHGGERGRARPAVPDPLEQLRQQLAAQLPVPLVAALLDSYAELREQYVLRHYGPSELSGDKFVEAVVRILQAETSAGSYAPLEERIPDVIGVLREFEQIPEKEAVESYRVHIPRTLAAIYSVRNKRKVGRRGRDVNPNFADATLVVTGAAWVLAELLRIHFNLPVGEAQKRVDTLVSRPLSLVQEVAGTARVLLPGLSQRKSVLVLLASVPTGEARDQDLAVALEPSSVTDFRKRVLGSLHAERLINYDRQTGLCTILPTGRTLVEEFYTGWQSQSQGGRKRPGRRPQIERLF